MIFTTRNLNEALRFIELLPFTEEEKERIKGFFPIQTRFMEDMKNNKSLNSKGGERWFMERMQKTVEKTLGQVSQLLRGLEGEELKRAQMVASQNALSVATLEMAREIGSSSEVLRGLEDHVDFMNHLMRKYYLNREEESTDDGMDEYDEE